MAWNHSGTPAFQSGSTDSQRVSGGLEVVRSISPLLTDSKRKICSSTWDRSMVAGPDATMGRRRVTRSPAETGAGAAGAGLSGAGLSDGFGAGLSEEGLVLEDFLAGAFLPQSSPVSSSGLRFRAADFDLDLVLEEDDLEEALVLPPEAGFFEDGLVFSGSGAVGAGFSSGVGCG